MTSIVNKQSPRSKKVIQHAAVSSTVLSPVIRALKATRKYRNASVRSSHKALLSAVATSQTNGSSHRDITSSLGVKWLSYVRAKNSISIDATIMQHSKEGAAKRPNIPLSTKKLVRELFSRENISRIVPNKNRTINIKTDGKKIKCPLRVMEKNTKSGICHVQISVS